MKIAFFSDTHSKHGFGSIGNYTPFKNVDTVVFCGDLTTRGHKAEVENFVHWFNRMPVINKVLICGNHDYFFERSSKEEVDDVFKGTDIIYLNDSGCTIDDVLFWGSPITPFFHNWAFNRRKGEEIDRHWQLIPAGVDVLVTHGPVYGILDEVRNPYSSDTNVGCKELKKHILERVKPQVHACGHIHEAQGMIYEQGITFINASILDEYYRPANDPIIIDINPKKKQ